MAKKPRQTKHTRTHLSNSPFKKLKGLSGIKEDSTRSDIKSSQQQSDLSHSLEATTEESFSDAMDALGVSPLEVGSSRPDKKLNDSKSREKKPLSTSREVREKELFLEAINAMDMGSTADMPDEFIKKHALPRRMKQVERGQLVPESEIDLHGMNIEEATRKVHFFLNNSIFHGYQTILVIVGKGLHSENGPVLRKAIEKLLCKASDQVLEWGVAPRRYGGEGALIVFLRGK